MAVSVANLTNGKDPSDLSTYSTASVTVHAGKPVYIGLSIFHNSAVVSPSSITVGSVTFSLIHEYISGAAGISVWGATPGSDTTGAISVAFSSAMKGLIWSVDEVSGGANSLATNFAHDSGTTSATPSVALPVAITSGNANLAYINRNDLAAATPGSGFTELSDQSDYMTAPTSAPRSLEGEWKLSVTTADWSFGAAATWKAVTLEVPASSGANQTINGNQLDATATLFSPSVTGGAANISYVHAGGGSITGQNIATLSATVVTGRTYYLTLAIGNSGGNAASALSVVGPGVNTWTKVGTVGSGTRVLDVWRLTPVQSYTSTNMTITFANTVALCEFLTDYVTGNDQVTPERNVSNATGTGTTASLTLPAFANSSNLAMVFTCAPYATAGNFTPGSGFTELGDQGGTASGVNVGVQSEVKVNTTAASATLATSVPWLQLAFEEQIASTGGQSIAAPQLQATPVINAPQVAKVGGGSGTWVWENGSLCGGGGINSVACDPVTEARIVASGDISGVFTTTDGGGSWKRGNGGLGDDNDMNTGAVEWSQDAAKPNRVWLLTSNGFYVSNDAGNTWLFIAGSPSCSANGTRPRLIGRMIADTGTGIVYAVADNGTAYRYNVSGANGDAGTLTIIGSAITSPSGITFNPLSIGDAYVSSRSVGLSHIPNADSRTGAGDVAVAGAPAAGEDCVGVGEGAAGIIYLAAGSAGVRAYATASGTWSDKSGNTTTGTFCSIDAYASGSNTIVAVGLRSGPTVNGNIVQYWTTQNARVASPTWVCDSLDDGNMALPTLGGNIHHIPEGPGGDSWYGYMQAAEGGGTGNLFRDDSSHCGESIRFSSSHRYLYIGGTGGVYRLDYTLKLAHPMMHKLSTTTQRGGRSHPSDPTITCMTNIDHTVNYTATNGAKWLKNEQGVTQGTMQGMCVCFDPGAAARVFVGHGARDSDSTGEVWYISDIRTPTTAVALNWPATGGKLPIGIDARRVGGTLYIFVTSLGDGIWRYACNPTTVTGGTWVKSSGAGFAATTGVENTDVRWGSDSVVYALDKESGLLRCSNPTAATPSWSNIWTAPQTSTERLGFMRLDESDVSGNTLFVSYPGGIFKVTNATGVITTAQVQHNGTNFANPGPIDCLQGTLYAIDGKAGRSDAHIYSGATSGTNLTTDISDTWFGANATKLEEMVINSDGSRITLGFRGGGIAQATRQTGGSVPQSVGAQFLDATPSLFDPGISVSLSLVAPQVNVAATLFSPAVSTSGTPAKNIGAAQLDASATVFAPSMLSAEAQLHTTVKKKRRLAT